MTIITDSNGSKWKVTHEISGEPSTRDIDIWTGETWKKRRVTSPTNTKQRVFTQVKTKAESNALRKNRVVSPCLRYYLEERGYYGKLNETGHQMLRAEYQRGGRKPKAPIWWIVKNAEELKKMYSRTKDRNGIALALSNMYYEEFGLNIEISYDDIKNARRAIK